MQLSNCLGNISRPHKIKWLTSLRRRLCCSAMIKAAAWFGRQYTIYNAAKDGKEVESSGRAMLSSIQYGHIIHVLRFRLSMPWRQRQKVSPWFCNLCHTHGQWREQHWLDAPGCRYTSKPVVKQYSWKWLLVWQEVYVKLYSYSKVAKDIYLSGKNISPVPWRGSPLILYG